MKFFYPLSDRHHRLLSFALVCLFIQMTALVSSAQKPEPQREQLLNGLRIMLLPRPGDATVLLRLRINSGAAFDPDGKIGTMALLGDILFPDPGTHDYFKEEIGGRLEVETDFDAINITLQGRASDYDRIVDILRAALVTTQITPENVAKVKETRIQALAGTKPSAQLLANRMISERLFGTFPYANSEGGTLESLGRIERSDLMLAREKFLNPNNATLVIIGGVDQRRAMRALRQLLGGWRKGDQTIQATFRQPTPADARVLIANAPGAQTTEVRLAVRAVARGDRDYLATSLLATVARARWQKQLTEATGKLFVKLEAPLLPGLFVMGATVGSTAANRTIESARQVLKSLVDGPISPAEVENARKVNNELIAISGDDSLANAWLDVESYSLPGWAEQIRMWNALSPTDLQRVAGRLFKEAALATVVIGNAEELKAQLTPVFAVEVLGEAAPKVIEPAVDKTSAEPPVKHRLPTFKPLRTTSPLVKPSRPAIKPD